MNEQEKAIFEIENYSWQSWEHGYPIKMTDKSTDVIIEALEKQIPMKGKAVFGGWLECPTCETEISGFEERPNYCPNCGQAIW